MAFWTRKEKRAAQVTQSQERFYEALGISLYGLDGDGTVTPDQALGVPAVWAAINFISGTIAGLPLNVYEKKRDGTKSKVRATPSNAIATMLHDAVNDDYSSFQWRFDLFSTGVLKNGRGVSYIERDEAGRPLNLFPMPNCKVKILANGRKRYETTTGGKPRSYDQSDVLDLTFMLADDLVTAISPLRKCAIAIGKAYHANAFGSKIFKNGGLPAFALEGPFGSEKAATRAADNVADATRAAAQKGANVLAIPLGHSLKPLGSDPDKMQLVEGQRFAIEEVARIYSLPPTFLQDLTHGTFSNTEQQDLHFVKHTLKRWIEQFEQEMNLKFFGRGSRRYVEFNVDGLLRGDYKTRMDGNAQAIQSGQLTPNEAREMDNREPLDGGNKLFIQGATVPLDGQGVVVDGGESDAGAEIDNLKKTLDAYGVGVRAGALTPQVDDEGQMRERFGLPALSAEAVDLWGKQGKVRQPITLQSGEEAGMLADAADAADLGDDNDDGT